MPFAHLLNLTWIRGRRVQTPGNFPKLPKNCRSSQLLKSCWKHTQKPWFYHGGTKTFSGSQHHRLWHLCSREQNLQSPEETSPQEITQFLTSLQCFQSATYICKTLDPCLTQQKERCVRNKMNLARHASYTNPSVQFVLGSKGCKRCST